MEAFFLYVMVVHNNPFSTYLTQVPADGRGLNPLLQNYWMVIHPPSQYIGFVSMTGRIDGENVTANIVSPSCNYSFQTKN